MLKRHSLSSALAVGLLATSALAQGSSVQVGDTLEYKFEKSPLQAMGVTSLEELRGKPVFVEWWGTR